MEWNEGAVCLRSLEEYLLSPTPDIDAFSLRALRAVIQDRLWVTIEDGSVALTTEHVAWQPFSC